MSSNQNISMMYPLVVAATALDHPVATATSIGGTRNQVLATAKVVSATRELSDCLALKDVPLRQVMSCIDRKNSAAAEFTRCVGAPWPL